LPMTCHCYNLGVWALAQSCGNGHHSLVTPKRVLCKYNQDLIFDNLEFSEASNYP